MNKFITDFIQTQNNKIYFKVLEMTNHSFVMTDYIPYDEYDGISDQLFADYIGEGINE